MTNHYDKGCMLCGADPDESHHDWCAITQAQFGEKADTFEAPVEDQDRHWQLTGGSSDYYKVMVTHPTTGPSQYMAECNDIIEALDMNFAEGNAFKAIWRRAAARKGNGKAGTTALYDAEKIVFFGGRLVEQAKRVAEGA